MKGQKLFMKTLISLTKVASAFLSDAHKFDWHMGSFNREVTVTLPN